MIAQEQNPQDAQLAHKAELKEKLERLPPREIEARLLNRGVDRKSKPSLIGRYMQQEGEWPLLETMIQSSFSHTHKVFTVADARRTLEDILAQEAADQAKQQEEAFEHCRTQPPPVEPQSRRELYESEEEVKPEATPSMHNSALAYTKMSPKPTEDGSAKFESISLRHAGIQIRWLRWGFCLILTIFLFLLVVDFILYYTRYLFSIRSIRCSRGQEIILRGPSSTTPPFPSTSPLVVIFSMTSALLPDLLLLRVSMSTP